MAKEATLKTVERKTTVTRSAVRQAFTAVQPSLNSKTSKGSAEKKSENSDRQ